MRAKYHVNSCNLILFAFFSIGGELTFFFFSSFPGPRECYTSWQVISWSWPAGPKVLIPQMSRLLPFSEMLRRKVHIIASALAYRSYYLTTWVVWMNGVCLSKINYYLTLFCFSFFPFAFFFFFKYFNVCFAVPVVFVTLFARQLGLKKLSSISLPHSVFVILSPLSCHPSHYRMQMLERMRILSLL